jgi:hypothetical protein
MRFYYMCSGCCLLRRLPPPPTTRLYARDGCGCTVCCGCPSKYRTGRFWRQDVWASVSPISQTWTSRELLSCFLQLVTKAPRFCSHTRASLYSSGMIVCFYAPPHLPWSILFSPVHFVMDSFLWLCCKRFLGELGVGGFVGVSIALMQLIQLPLNVV